MNIAVVFGLIAFAGVFLFFLGISQMRRAAARALCAPSVGEPPVSAGAPDSGPR